MHRRSLLATLGSGFALTLAGCTGGDVASGTTTTPPTDTLTDTGASTPEPTTTVITAQSPYGTWFQNTDNYERTVDRTGRDEVRIAVGTAGNDGNFAYDPAAVEVSTGTTVLCEWTGEGGQHNVLERDGEFESALVAEAGHTFQHEFRQPGTFLYLCVPHKSIGMHGAVRVTGDPVTRQRPRTRSGTTRAETRG
jgi:halocyanin-like protein